MKRLVTPVLLMLIAVYGTVHAADDGKTYTEDEINKMNEDARKTKGGPDLRKVHPPKEPIQPTEKTTPTPTLTDPKGTKP